MNLRETMRSIVERIRDIPLWLSLTMQGARFDAHPLDLWWNSCPICGEAFRGHRIATLGARVFPCEEFLSAVENRDWERVVQEEAPDEPIGSNDLAVAIVLACPTGKLAVIAYQSPCYPWGSFSLLSNQILSDQLAENLLAAVVKPKWRPAITDRLENTREMRREMTRRVHDS